MNEYILAAVIRLDESEALLAVEPLHGFLRHMTLYVCTWSRGRGAGSNRVSSLEEDRQSDALVAARPSHSAEAR
jgi:hypothetical protein